MLTVPFWFKPVPSYTYLVFVSLLRIMLRTVLVLMALLAVCQAVAWRSRGVRSGRSVRARSSWQHAATASAPPSSSSTWGPSVASATSSAGSWSWSAGWEHSAGSQASSAWWQSSSTSWSSFPAEGAEVASTVPWDAATAEASVDPGAHSPEAATLAAHESLPASCSVVGGEPTVAGAPAQASRSSSGRSSGRSRSSSRSSSSSSSSSSADSSSSGPTKRRRVAESPRGPKPTAVQLDNMPRSLGPEEAMARLQECRCCAVDHRGRTESWGDVTVSQKDGVTVVAFLSRSAALRAVRTLRAHGFRCSLV